MRRRGAVRLKLLLLLLMMLLLLLMRIRLMQRIEIPRWRMMIGGIGVGRRRLVRESRRRLLTVGLI